MYSVQHDIDMTVGVVWLWSVLRYFSYYLPDGTYTQLISRLCLIYHSTRYCGKMSASPCYVILLTLWELPRTLEILKTNHVLNSLHGNHVQWLLIHHVAALIYALYFTHCPRVPGALSLGVKRQGREADHSPQSSAEVPQYVFMAWYLVKHRDNFTFYLELTILRRHKAIWCSILIWHSNGDAVTAIRIL